MAARKKPPMAPPSEAPAPLPPPSPSLFGEPPKPVKEWPGLFQVFANPDGTRRVEYATELSRRHQLLMWKLSSDDNCALGFIFALQLLPGVVDLEVPQIPEPVFAVFQGCANLAEIVFAARRAHSNARFFQTLLRNLREGFGVELAKLTQGTLSERRKSLRIVTARVAEYLSAMTERHDRPPFSNVSSVTALLASGQLVAVTIPFAALEIAAQYVAENGELPTKQLVRQRIEGSFRVKLSPAKWSRVWKESGLESLPHDKPKTRQSGMRVDSNRRR